MQDDFYLTPAYEISRLVNSQEISALEVTKRFLTRAKALDKKLNAFNFFTEDLAFAQAERVDQEIKNNRKQFKLAGVPVAIKDNLCVKSIRTTCSSKILENFISPYESTVTGKLWQEGAICLGKTNLDEFAMGSSTEHSAFHGTYNPWDLSRVPGGSSGGSAVAVSSRMVPLSLGSDTGGSIRQPASLCGTIGMKPTYGTVSRFGLVAFASSLDQVGPFANNTKDLKLILSIISGHDPKDSTSLPVELSFHQEKLKNLKNLKLGVASSILRETEKISPEVFACFNKSIDFFCSQGAQIIELNLENCKKYALDIYYIIAPAEASSNLARYDGVLYGLREENQVKNSLIPVYKQTRQKGFGTEVKRRIMIGTHVLSSSYYDAYYKKAQDTRELIRQEFSEAFSQVDLILSPTSPVTAFKFGEKTKDPISMYLCDIATIPANLAELPGLSINSGFDSNNLPIGLQIISKRLEEHKILDFASFYEESYLQKEVAPRLPELVF